MDPLAAFSPPTRAWFTAAFAEPTEIQAAAWRHIVADRSVLAVAPTGSGKTLAAFLWAIDRCLTPRATTGVRILYVSPLKALAVDVERNLRAPLAGIAGQAVRMELPKPQVSVGVRTGDTSARDRQAMLRRPPDVLITTPESLFLLLTSQGREILREVETVIVDEVHAIAGTKRGAHLAVTLARLDHLAGRSIPRIGLSATVRPAEEAARFLGGATPVEVVRAPATKEWDLQIQVPVEDMADLAVGGGPEATPSTSIWPHVESRIVDLIEAHRSTIVFSNSRRLAERLTARLNELHAERGGAPPEREGGAPGRAPAEVMAQAGASAGAPALLARAHHGSVSKEQRALIEDDLKTGRLRAVVATSSLELGIDMGAVDLVIQVEAPPSVASGLQRVGRAGHQVGAVSEGVVLPKHRADLLASAVVVSRMRAGELESLHVPANPLDVAAQQVVACVAMEDWPVEELLGLFRRTASFRDLTPAVFTSVLDMLAGRYPSDAFAELRPRLVWDRREDVLRARPGAQRLAVTSGGTIPDRGLFPVHLEGGSRVGELDEEMVHESRVGDTIALGASSWTITGITHDRVHVVPAPGAPGRLPFWRGDALGRPAELGAAIGAFTRELARQEAELAVPWLTGQGLDAWAAANLVGYVREQEGSGSRVPTDRTIVVERSRDELGDWRLTVLSPFGARVHAPWALLARERLAERFGVDAAVLHGDDGIVARLPDVVGDDWLADATACLFPPADEVEAGVTRLVGSSALFASRFRECASRALLLPRPQPGRRAPLWQQRQRSAQLLQVAAEHPTFPIVLETVRECLQDVFDLPALVGLLTAVEQRKVRVVEASPIAPSPFARSLLFGYVAEFLYEGDSPLAERRAAALTLDPTLLGELLGQADLRELLEPEAIADVVAGLQHLDPQWQARGPEDAADQLRVLGPMSTQEASRRGILEPWLSSLAEQRRVFRTRVASQDVWALAEDAARLRDGLGAPLPPGLAQAHLDPVPDAIGDLVSRYARTHGPFTTSQAAEALGLPTSVVATRLADARAAGRLVEGRFLQGAAGTQWITPEVLRLVKRRSVALLRHQIEPVSQAALAAWLPRWQHIGPHAVSTLRGAEGVLEVVRELAGLPLPASALETAILPARVVGYTPAMLDALTASGEVRWTGTGSLPGGDAWIALAPSELAGLLPRAPDPPDSPLAARALALLERGGGWFLADVASELGRRADPEGAAEGSPPDAGAVADALRSLLWAGLISNDTIEPVRARRDRAVANRRSPGTRPVRLGRAPRSRYADLRRGPVSWGATAPPARDAPVPARPWDLELPGRWFALPVADASAAEAHAVGVAESHLDRLGVVTRAAILAAGDAGGFAGAYRILSAMEERGRVQRVYAVDGLGGAQFALPGVVDQLREVERELAEGRAETVVLAACDPANAYGGALDWPASGWAGAGENPHRPGRSAGSTVVLHGGRLVLYVERGGRSLLTFPLPEEGRSAPPGDVLATAASALHAAVRSGLVAPLTVTRINGVPALAPHSQDTQVRDALTAAGFSQTPRGYRARP